MNEGLRKEAFLVLLFICQFAAEGADAEPKTCFGQNKWGQEAVESEYPYISQYIFLFFHQ